MADDKNNSKNKRIFSLERWVEIITWVVMLLVLIVLRLIPQDILSDDVLYYFMGALIGFALLYYLVIYRVFNKIQRLWIKDIADIVLISALIIVAGEYGKLFYSLYFLPIAAAALVLGTIDSLLMATISCLFIILETYLNAEGVIPDSSEYLLGIWRIGFIILVTLFCRFLAMQVREERKGREEAAARAKALEITEKREREFMTLTAHQLFTPLSIIRGFSSMLYHDEKKKMTKRQQDYTKEIYKNTVRMVHLVSELLSISKVRTDNVVLKKSPIIIKELINHVIEQLKPQAEKKNIVITYNVEKDLPEIKVDPIKMEQALYNVVDNAVKFTDIGSVTISVSIVKHNLTIKIEDTGRGIVPDDMEKLFQPFFRGKNILELEKEGTGLGLYLAKTIIEKHDGHIWASSEYGKGSIFIISIPIKN